MKESPRISNLLERSGRIYEHNLFGEVKTDSPSYKEEIRKCKPDSSGYIPFKCALEVVKKFQPGDPVNPSHEFANTIRIAVIDELGIEDPEQMEKIRFYTAVGSPLDHWHGVDAFIEVDFGNGKKEISTFNSSLRQDRAVEDIKADILVGSLPDPEESEKEYWKKIEEIAKKAAEKIRPRVQKQ